MGIDDVKLWISCNNLEEYHRLQKYLIDSGYKWDEENYYNYGVFTKSTVSSYRELSHILPSTYITIGKNNLIDVFHSIILGNTKNITTTEKFIRKLKLQKINEN
jgi:hypothetical protein